MNIAECCGRQRTRAIPRSGDACFTVRAPLLARGVDGERVGGSLPGGTEPRGGGSGLELRRHVCEAEPQGEDRPARRANAGRGLQAGSVSPSASDLGPTATRAGTALGAGGSPRAPRSRSTSTRPLCTSMPRYSMAGLHLCGTRPRAPLWGFGHHAWWRPAASSYDHDPMPVAHPPQRRRLACRRRGARLRGVEHMLQRFSFYQPGCI